MAETDDSGDYIAKEKDKFRYRRVLRIRDGKKVWVNVGTPIKQPEPYKTSYGSVITGEFKPIYKKRKTHKKVYANSYKRKKYK